MKTIKNLVMQFPLLLVGLCFVLSYCQGKKDKDPLLYEAYEYHTEAAALRNSLQSSLNNLAAGLEEGDSLAKLRIDEIKHKLTEWDHQFVEVPGFEEECDHDHDHDHDHGHHHHHHKPAPGLTPLQHKELQKFLLDELLEIETQTKNL
ncbi:MAG: hypothetical protein JJU28_02660 [Cyclobacteriaceae bacterium]|nr:hypothetical protein [Cyclobacteriaceae bacterium]